MGVGWRKCVQTELSDLNLIFLDPTNKPLQPGYACEDLESHQRRKEQKKNGDFDALAHEMRLIRCIDLRLADLCDFAIAHLDRNIYSTGTHEELALLNRRKVPVLIHVEQGKAALPDWYWGAFPQAHIFGDWTSLYEHLRHVAHDPAPIETYNRWRFIDYGMLYQKNTITLTSGVVAKISPEDHEYISRFSWHGTEMRAGTYAHRKIQKRQGGVTPMAMHVEIAARAGLKLKKGQQIDHWNRDTLDNRRENLRIGTPTQQSCNQGLRTNNTSGVKGVSFDKHKSKWHAYVAINGKRRFNKYFRSKKDAELAVREARLKLHGAFACHGDGK